MKVKISYRVDPQYNFAFVAIAEMGGIIYEEVGKSMNEARSKLISKLRKIREALEKSRLMTPPSEEVEI